MCGQPFQTRQCEYCYPLNEFFIPALYCYSLGIPETPFLMLHSFPGLVAHPSVGLSTEKLNDLLLNHMRFPIIATEILCSGYC